MIPPSICRHCGGKGKVHEWIDIDDDEFYKATAPCPVCRDVNDDCVPGTSERYDGT